MPKIYITRKILHIAEEKLKNAGHEVFVNPSDKILSKEELIVELKKEPYDAVLCLLTDKIDKDVYDAVPTAKIFSNYAVGFNNIDIEEAKKRGIIITNTPGVLSESVAELTLALMMTLSRRIVEADKYTRDDKYIGWDPLLFLGTDLAGKTLGLLGAGRIGSLVAEKCIKGFGMRVLYYDVKRNQEVEKIGAEFRETLEDVLREADFVSIHVPLLESTKHLINKERLSLMKKTAYLINTSRGEIIDEKALAEALASGVIAGAGLDVYEKEPEIEEGLKKLSNVILTPHIASATLETRTKMAEMASDAIIDFLQGKTPKNIVE